MEDAKDTGGAPLELMYKFLAAVSEERMADALQLSSQSEPDGRAPRGPGGRLKDGVVCIQNREVGRRSRSRGASRSTRLEVSHNALSWLPVQPHPSAGTPQRMVSFR